jgi:hypothetical protein
MHVVGSEYDSKTFIVCLPKIKPRIAYLLLAINLGVYGAGLVAGLGPEGADAQQDYFLALAKTDVGVEAGEYYRCVLCLLHPKPLMQYGLIPECSLEMVVSSALHATCLQQ